MRFAIIFLSLVCYASTVVSQAIVYEKFDVDDGLPQSYVSDVVQDQYGFIWIAALDGIVKYDGQQFTPFNVGLNSEKGFDLSTSQVVDLYLDNEGMLWLLHFNQVVDRLNPATHKVDKNVSPAIKLSKDDLPVMMAKSDKRFYTDNSSEHWFFFDKEAYFLFDSTLLEKNLLTNIENLQESNHIVSFCYSSPTDLLLATYESVILYDLKEHKTDKIDFSIDLVVDQEDRIYSDILQLNDSIFIISIEDRLIEFNKENKTVTELALPHPYLREEKNILRSNNAIQGLQKDYYDRAIFELDGKVYEYDGAEINVLWVYPFRENYNINVITVDKTNSLWVGTNTNGLYKINLNQGHFRSNKYETNFIVDILLHEFDLPVAKIPNNWWLKAWAYGLRYEYSLNGDLYITQESYGYGQDRVLYKLEGNSLIKLKAPSDPEMYFTGVALDGRYIWAIDNYGYLFKWDNDYGNPVITRFKDIEGADQERVLDLVTDKDNLWIISLENKLYKLQDSEIVKEYSPGDYNFSLVDLCQDTSDPDLLWISTLGGGLIKWSKSLEKTIKTYSETDGLPNNSTVSIKMAADGKLWLATFDGLTSFDPITEEFISYSTADGIIESEFNRHHGFELPDGRIAFGGTFGYSIFNPLSTTKEQIQTKVAISTVAINNEAVEYSPTGILNKPINELDVIKIDHTISSISFDVAIVQYTNVEWNKLRYQLDGFSKGWVDLGRDRKIRFEQLPTGTYTLYINASNTNGIWSSYIKELAIIVPPPPWFAWWALVLYALLALFIIAFYWRRYRNKIRREQEAAFARKEAERLQELDELKTRFFSNITHEFRTPLTLILSPLEKEIERGAHKPEVMKLLKSNYRNGQQLLNLVNELLDIGKLDSGSMQSFKSSGDLVSFVHSSLDQFRSIAEQKNIDLTFKSNDGEGNYLFDKGFLEKILNNLLSNALKFTPDGGRVEVSLRTAATGQIELRVKDTGRGIAKTELNKLFDRFYQVDSASTRQHEGTGIGLALVKELIDLMDGEISVDSELGKGSVFTVTLRLERINQVENKVLSTTLQRYSNQITIPEDTLIMVVEDNDELRKFIVDSLGDKWQVLEAADGLEAEEIIYNQLPDLIISDVMMPGIDGYELCRRVKNDLRTGHINFIILSAKSAQESKIKGLNAGADDYLTKPFHANELELRVNNVLKTQQELREHMRSLVFPLTPGKEISNVKDEFVRKAYLIIDQNLTNSSFGVEYLARELNMSKSTLNRKLRSILKTSANEFVRNYRLKKAAIYISSGHEISRAGYEVGFESPSYFSKCFKEAFGKSPSEYLATV